MKDDRILFHLCPGWALAADRQQWILLAAEKRGREAVKRHRRAPWRAVSFIGSTKAVLLRVVSEKGIEPTPQGRAALDALPDRFTATAPPPLRSGEAAASATRRAA